MIVNISILVDIYDHIDNAWNIYVHKCPVINDHMSIISNKLFPKYLYFLYMTSVIFPGTYLGTSATLVPGFGTFIEPDGKIYCSILGTKTTTPTSDNKIMVSVKPSSSSCTSGCPMTGQTVLARVVRLQQIQVFLDIIKIESSGKQKEGEFTFRDKVSTVSGTISRNSEIHRCEKCREGQSQSRWIVQTWRYRACRSGKF